MKRNKISERFQYIVKWATLWAIFAFSTFFDQLLTLSWRAICLFSANGIVQRLVTWTVKYIQPTFGLDGAKFVYYWILLLPFVIVKLVYNEWRNRNE